jgi:predicted PurR-regulated permease PerM
MAVESEIPETTTAQSPRGPQWSRLRDIPITILAWMLVIGLLLWVAGHVIGTLLVIGLAVLLAYGLLPLVRHLSRLMPRPLAIAVVYIAFFSALSGLVYLVVDTAVLQVVPLSDSLRGFLSDHTTQLQALLGQLGITPNELQSLGTQLFVQAQNVAGTLVPLVGDFAGVAIDIVVVTVLSIYFVINAPQVDRWLRSSAPLDQRERFVFVLDTLNRVLGGYIRGQVTLALLIGLLVGLGMQILQLPYAVLLGVLAFVLEFIPFLGVLASGTACVLVGLTVGPLTALAVLLYFIGVHVVEGELVGPRIVGNAVGLHPAVSLVALIAGAELFGVWGALFAAPVAGVLQALGIAIYETWRREHPEQFPDVRRAQDAIASGEHQGDVAERTQPATVLGATAGGEQKHR